MRKLSVFAFLLMPALGFAEGPHCAVPPAQALGSGSEPTGVFKIPAPVLPAAVEPVASSSAHALALAGPVAPSAAAAAPGGAALTGSIPPALSSTQILAVPALARCIWRGQEARR